MTLEGLQDELARMYMRAGEQSQIAAEHAKARRYSHAYRCECDALKLQKAAGALWPAIAGAIVAGAQRKDGGDEAAERARRCAEGATP